MSDYLNKIFIGDWITIAEGLPDRCVQTCITSPPYWGQRDYSTDGQLGLEETPEEHIENLVKGFREIRRILRDDGILWVNYGDKYTGNGGDHKVDHKNDASFQTGSMRGTRATTGMGQQGDLIGLAWRFALAMQKDGWILRDDIIWAKAISFNDKYSGSCMPESHNGTRWERCRVKVKPCSRPSGKLKRGRNDNGSDWGSGDGFAEWADCPGCEKCKPNDGLVLRQGSWRCTSAHEHVFQFVKQIPYFSDMNAIKEDAGSNTHDPGQKLSRPIETAGIGHVGWSKTTSIIVSSRNLRNVWTINPQPNNDLVCLGCGKDFTGRARKRITIVVVDGEKKQKCPDCEAVDQWLGHYATFPEKLIEPLIKASTSQKGCCPKCGAAWARIIDTMRSFQSGSGKSGNMPVGKNGPNLQGGGETLDVRRGPCVETTTLGWKPTCTCPGLDGDSPGSVCADESNWPTVPCVVYDPFMGSGTVAAVAAKLGRNYIGCDINADYVEKQALPRIHEAETGITKNEVGQMAMFAPGPGKDKG